MLSIMSLALRGSGGNELVKQQGSSEERRKQIFGLYVEQMFQRKGMTSPKFPKEKIIDWVSWLARKMSERSQSVFLVEGLQPSWLDRFSPEKCLFFVRHSLQDITVRGRVITNSNVLCYDNIPLCKELIWRSLGDAERHPGRVAILWLCFATLLRPLS